MCIASLSTFIGEILVAFSAGVAVSHIAEIRTRWQLAKVSRQLAGMWIAHNIRDGNKVETSYMEGSWATHMKARNRFSGTSHVLDITAKDTSDTPEGPVLRPHSGFLVVDRVAPWRATRVVFYHGSAEAFEQQILISSDKRMLYVTAHMPPNGYKPHVLRKDPEA
jgi:hypothetical protein